MDKILLVIVFFSTFFRALAVTHEFDVAGLKALFLSLHRPKQLQNWSIEGLDPCGESWMGVACLGEAVVHIELRGLNLTGDLGFQLFRLGRLQTLDVSFNKLEGLVPKTWPPKLTHLNLSHNAFSGPLGKVFGELRNLTDMDLSFNKFTLGLPESFRDLTSLQRLFLENNEFNGSVTLLADLSLSEFIGRNDFEILNPNKRMRSSGILGFGVAFLVLVVGFFLGVLFLRRRAGSWKLKRSRRDLECGSEMGQSKTFSEVYKNMKQP